MVLGESARRLEEHVARVVPGDAAREADGRQHARLGVVVILDVRPVEEDGTQPPEGVVRVDHLEQDVKRADQTRRHKIDRQHSHQ